MKPVAGRFRRAADAGGIHRRFIDWVAAYTLSPPGTVMRMSLTAPKALEPPRSDRSPSVAAQTVPPDLTLTAARRRVLDALDERGTATARTSWLRRRAAAFSGGARPGRCRRAWRRSCCRRAIPLRSSTGSCTMGRTLSREQAMAADRLKAKAGAGLFGDPARRRHRRRQDRGLFRGDRRQYRRRAAVAGAAAGNRAVGAGDRPFSQSASAPAPALWHSDVGPAGRRMTWRGVAEGKTKVVVGARSALFLPYPDLGLIVVDEEHEAAFKQEDGVIYHARDMAVARAHLGGFRSYWYRRRRRWKAW